MGLALRGLAALLAGAAYGLFVGAVVFLFTYKDRYTPYPGPLIPNKNETARMVTVLAALVAGACGALVGLAVGLSGADRRRAAAIGFGLGLVVMTLIFGFDNSLPALVRGDRVAWRAVLMGLLFLPCGLALTGAAASAVTAVLRPHG
jgi:hypothetical protein